MISEITEKKNTFRYQIKNVAHSHNHIYVCFFQFGSWENPHFSSNVLSELLWQVS